MLVWQVISTFSQQSHFFSIVKKQYKDAPSFLHFAFLSSSRSSIFLLPTILIPIILPFHCPILSISPSSYFSFHSSLLPPLILSSPSFRYIILAFHPPSTLFILLSFLCFGPSLSYTSLSFFPLYYPTLP